MKYKSLNFILHWKFLSVYLCTSRKWILENSADLDQSHTIGSEYIPFQKTNGIYHRFPIQTKKSQTEGKQIMPKTRFIEFAALSVGLRAWISRSASETDV